MDKISVIVPIYNVEDYVAQCIESICAQTYTNLEIILVNDGSTDNCLTIMEKYAAKDDRVVVINQKNQGANAARNSGLLQATGEWVCFVDGDDWIDTIMCEELSKYFSQDWDVIFYSYRKVYPSGISEKKYSDGCFEITKEDFRELQLATLNRLGPYRFGVNTMETVSIVDKIYRREFLIKNNLFLNEKLPKLQDLFFNLQIYDYANRGFVVNKVFYNYRIYGGSVSRRYQKDIVMKFQLIHKYLDEFIKKHPDDKEMRQAYYERIVTHLRTCTVLDFCHSENKKSYKERKTDFLAACRDKTFSDAMKNANLNNFSFRERILSKVIKMRWFAVCEFLYKLNRLYEKYM